MAVLKESLVEIQILGYFRVRQDGEIIYSDFVEGDCVGAFMLRICNLDLKSVPFELGGLIDIMV